MSLFRVRPEEYLFEENCHITEWWNNPEDNHVSVSQARVEPGATTRLHSVKKTTERYIIIEGEGLAEVGYGKPENVSRGDVLVIPPGRRQRITNTGSGDLIFLAVCTPRFITDNYNDNQSGGNSLSEKVEMPSIKTERLVLRPLKLSDGPDIQRLAGDISVADTTVAIPHPYPDGEAEKWISRHEAEFLNRKSLILGVFINETGELAGCISIMDINEADNSGELGYWMAKDKWGNGFCTEAACGLLGYAFKDLELNRVHAKHFARNAASGRVMEKAGMKREGYLRQAFVKWGKYEDLVLYAILREDWLENR